ncbi:hypothetical protein RvY_05918 [Ramazzottius varieornatus]|uniref:DDE Tnp4 domain-containing protein n=1 Tax=Ramazzottius varieornatus TaxID=947166 RepID=A0A1D1UWT1_RAMVA|nr:hypothetical protein RvY_05918 [Ramazzottius varieornatus]
MDKKLLVIMCEEGDIDEEKLVILGRLTDQAKMRPGDFDLYKLSRQDCLEDFRFSSHQLEILKEALEFPDIMYTDAQNVIPGMEALCILLRRLAYPNRLCDLEKLFGRNRSIFTLTHRPLDYATQNICYTGHKKEHDLKYTGVMTLCGIMYLMCGPEPGSFHDAKLLYRSEILNMMKESRTWPPTPETGYYLYGDQAYKSTPQVVDPVRYNASPLETACNTAMKTLRISVEWGFGKIGNPFFFNKALEALKLGLQPLGMYFRVATLLTNYHTCLNGSQTSNSFAVEPPTLAEYLENYLEDHIDN